MRRTRPLRPAPLREHIVRSSLRRRGARGDDVACLVFTDAATEESFAVLMPLAQPQVKKGGPRR